MQNSVVAVFRQKDGPHEHRCPCGSLLAKLTSQGIELKCRKCKRVQLIPNSRILGTLRTAAVEV